MGRPVSQQGAPLLLAPLPEPEEVLGGCVMMPDGTVLMMAPDVTAVVAVTEAAAAAAEDGVVARAEGGATAGGTSLGELAATEEVEEAAVAALMAELVEEGVDALGMLNCEGRRREW